MNIGNAIKVCRTTKSLSQRKLADLISISPSHLSLIEKGQREPSLTVLNSISSSLEIPVSILMFLAQDKEDITNLPDDLTDKIYSFTMRLLAEDE